MIFGFFTYRPTLRGLVTRPVFAALCLTLALPAHAGWWGRTFGAAAEQKTEAPALVAGPVSLPATPGSQAIAPASLDAPGNSANDPAALALTAAQDGIVDADTEDDNAVLLPNVEESLLGEVDGPDTSLDQEALVAKGDLWERMRAGFQMDIAEDNDRISVQRNWYLQHGDYLDRMAKRATRYLHYTVTEAEKRGMPTELALLPVIESAYDPFAYSHASAAGMWQFIPGTGKIFGLKQTWWYDGRRDVVESTRAAYDFLGMLYSKFGDWQLVLAAYNAGPGAVQRAINRNLAAGLPTDFWSLKLPAETRAYVPRFLAVAQIIKSPESFGRNLRPVVNQPFFRSIPTNGQIDMTAAAQIAGVSLKELYQLNPGYNRWATDPEGPHRLLVPASLPQDFEAQITALPVPERVAATTYKVKKGDTLYRVSRQFGITPDELKRLNNLKTNSLPAGHTLTITRASMSPEFIALNQEMHLDHMGSDRDGSAGNISKSYKVRRGDTLASIARRHGVSAKNIARWNNISARSRVHAGQRLTLQISKQTGRQRLAGADNKKGGAVKGIHYQVKKGDTLSSISRRYNVSVKQIKRWNASSHKIQPGQGLVLFVASNSSKRSL
ncbi:MAG: LysM peptidoglycan-binding domain-containing protein [bacterium]|nr:LysM peptidoglycan-binding domain-containing protein [bacterium]